MNVIAARYRRESLYEEFMEQIDKTVEVSVKRRA